MGGERDANVEQPTDGQCVHDLAAMCWVHVLGFGGHPLHARLSTTCCSLRQAVSAVPADTAIEHGAGVCCVAWSPCGTRIATRSDDLARIVDAATGTVQHEIKHGAAVFCVAWSPRGSRLATGSYDKMARILVGMGARV